MKVGADSVEAAEVGSVVIVVVEMVADEVSVVGKSDE